MTGFDQDLLAHLRLDALLDGAAADSSPHARHGVVTGTPTVVPDDQFGSCLRFGGTDHIRIADLIPSAAGPNPPHSVTGWVRVDSYPARRAWLVNLGQSGVGAHHWLLNPGGNTQLGVWSGAAATPKLPLGRWIHLATVHDGTSLTCYVDGEPTGAALPAKFNFTSYRGDLARAEESESGFAGRMAGFRVYARALSAADVGQVMDDDRSAMAAFRRSHPLAFSLHDSDAQPVLAIVDDPTGTTMQLEVTNTASQAVQLSSVPTGAAHLELGFRPGVLALDPTDPLTVTGPTGWKSSVGTGADGGTTVALVGPEGTTVDPGKTLRFTLRNIGADGRGGTRGTRVQLRYDRLTHVDDVTLLTGRRVQHLSLVNRRGQQHIPLQVGFVGFNTILSDGVSSATLRLRLTNVSKQPIPLAPSGGDAPSALLLSFDNQPADWAMGTTAQLKSVTVSADKWVATVPTEQGQTLQWRLTTPTQVALGAGESILVTLAGLIGRPPSGHARLLLHYENMPGYWDGHLAVVIEKAPLVYRDVTLPGGTVDARVGIGVSAPQAKLHVGGGAIMPSAGTGEQAGILFPKDPGGGGSDAAWIRYYPRSGERTTLEIGTSNDPDDHIALMSSGNVGINTVEPGGRLHIVHTPQNGNGNALVIGPTTDSHLRLGYHTDYSWIQSHGNRPLLINPISNRVGLGLADPTGTLDIARGSAPGGTLQIRGSQRISHFNYDTDEHTYLRGGKTNANVYINDNGGNVVVGSTDPQGHRLFVNGPAKVLGLTVNSGTRFGRIQAGHFEAGSHSGGVKEVQITFPERFSRAPMVMVTVRNEGYYADTFTATVKYVDNGYVKVNILRVDSHRARWDQNVRLDWFAWE
ncbi:LamG domain-containing protein [Micromonospora sp. NPDC000207]|uniref:LamG domain-containing protein n=1 Tax=Micromonospora sp. NPDC000207 TaxID=3154246 RepID=UPI00332A5D7A